MFGLPSALNSSVINNDFKEFGNLQEFITPPAYSTLLAALPTTFKGTLKAVKIFPGLSTTDTLSESRLGETIRIPNFWTALLLVLPPTLKVHSAHNIFNGIQTVAAYAHPNLIATLFSVPDDSAYSKQYSLHTNTVYPNCDVNVEEAWGVIPSGGNSGIRGIVFDQSVDWEHKDFGYDGANPATSKISGGYDRIDQVLIKSVPRGGSDGSPHGTSVAGIISAQRNNTVGIAGIAGGNDSTGSKGINIYNMSIFDPNGLPGASPNNAVLTNVADCILRCAQDPSVTNNGNTKKYCFKGHFVNHSWGLYAPPGDTGYYAFYNESNSLFSEAIHTVNRLKVTSIAARGNSGFKTFSYPASCDDDWVINVTGTGSDGQFIHDSLPFVGAPNGNFTSSYGGDIDLGAPASYSTIMTLGVPTNTFLGPVTYTPYINIGGTSMAAPHVSGAVGLMMSYMNDSTNLYRNMAPEDCEAILQLTATDTDTLGYDQVTGYGRVNIGKAMKLIQKPYHKLLHFGTNSFSAYSVSKTLLSAVDTIRTIERFERLYPTSLIFQKRKYIVKTFQITSTVNHNISPNDTIIGYWPRPSSSITWPLFTGTGSAKKLTPREKTKILTLNNGSATLRGYIYQVKDSLGTPIGWWPCDTAYANLAMYGRWAEYSVLTKNFSTDVGIKKHTEAAQNISVYPNPTSGNQTLVIQTNKVCNLTIDLYDVMGRKVKTIYSGKSEQEKTVINHDVANLPNSLYLYNITLDGVTTSKKFIKQ